MGNIPVIHEVATSFMSLGDAIAGDPQAARDRWDKYAKESIVGSACAALHHGIHDNEEEAKKYAKGLGRATGQLLLGGGILENVPVFQELATAGKSLGDVIGGGDDKAARDRWGEYAENSVIGSTCYAMHEDIHGNHKRAEVLISNAGKATLSAATTVATTALTVCTGGVAAPLGVPAAAAIGASMGASTSVLNAAVNAGIYDKELNPGDLIGGGLFGGVAGGVSGGLQAKAHAKAMKNITDAERLVETGEQTMSRGDPNGTVSCKMYDKEGHSYEGFNARARGKQLGASNRRAAQVGNSERAFPGGTPNLDAASNTPGVQSRLRQNGGENWPMRNCAEPHAYESMKGARPNTTPEANYTIKQNPTGPTVKAPCNNCTAMGDNYGRTPFAGHDGMPVVNAALSKLDGVSACTAVGSASAMIVVAVGSSPKK
eukprot:GEMP01020439.1.p1 GENE.GEMP01020439.1~~GEMP01020439.1.p1  ORF type:complete len:460 (+),score=127.90 GEMP01020439.1:90-1382(+)